MADKSIEKLEEERLMLSLNKKNPQTNPQPTRPVYAQTPTPAPQPTKKAPEQQWKYQQKQQQQPSAVLTGPVMDLSTRVNYLNSLYEQGSINDEEYQKRSEVLQIVGKIADCVMNGDDVTLRQLLNDNPQLDLNQVQENEATIVHIATDAICGGTSNSRVLEVICSRGASADSVRKGLTPLLNLCQYINKVQDAEDCVRVLLNHGASVKAAVRDNNSPNYTRTSLDLAVTGSAPIEVIKLLCQYGADPNVNTDQGPLINWCCIYGKVDEARIILEARANPNSRVPGVGANCLASAINDNNVELVQLLLKYGADKNAPVLLSQGSENSIQLAQILKLPDLQKILGK